MPSELRNYYPGPRERTEQFLRDLIAGDTRPTAVQARQARGLTDLLDFTPVGALFGAYDAANMGAAGITNANLRQIAGGVALGTLAALPLARKMSKAPTTHAAYYRRPYDPPKKPERPFEADYPDAVPADAEGRLTHDIEGRPLTAQRVVGRNMVGGRDEAFPATEFDALSDATTWLGTLTLPPGKKGAPLGLTPVDENGPLFIALSSALSEDRRRRVYAHEIGHVIDELAGQIPYTEGLSDELIGVYNTLNNPWRARGGEAIHFSKVQPSGFGYQGEEIPREFWAEAIRAYLTDPNYLKTVAPKVGAVIRAAVNANPKLNKIIQFNSAIAPVAGADLLSTSKDEMPNEGAHQNAAQGGRVEPSGPSAGDDLATDVWMKRRREQLGKSRR